MSIINIDESKCVGCNSCVRVCPSEAANTAKMDANGNIIIAINDDMCIKCGACIRACTHGARYYLDDTEEFMKDVLSGKPTAMVVAPAIKIAFKEDWADLLAFFRKKGVKFIYDVSFGADICTWVHVRYMEKNPKAKIISQPCAAIVNYIVKHNHDLVDYLSPGQSPMMCTAIYMRKYDKFNGTIAAISPCIAKKDEFKQNNYTINYNVTLEKLKAYLASHNMDYHGAAGGKKFVFDGPQGFVGSYYPQPGGLKENLRIHAPNLPVSNSEGTERIYHELDQYVTTMDKYRPPVFDVLNCQFGCNGGPALGIEYEPFKIASDSYDMKKATNDERMKQVDKKGSDKQFEEFDAKLKIEDFLRKYIKENTGYTKPSESQVQEGLRRLRKSTPTECHYDCHACGYKSCRDMAAAVEKGMNVPENCRQYLKVVREEESANLEKVNSEVREMASEIAKVIDLLSESVSKVEEQVADIRNSGMETSKQMELVNSVMGKLNSQMDGILDSMKIIDRDIENYSEMTKSVESIAGKINLLSLNAAIESARAGEAGRSFAVIAQNIRVLSDSSKDSVATAKESEESIRSSVTNVSESVKEFSEKIESLTNEVATTKVKVDAVSERSELISETMVKVAEIARKLDRLSQISE